MDELFPDTICKHEHVRFIPTPEMIHYGKNVCLDCGKFLCWLPKPETVQRAKENQEKIDALSKLTLTSFESELIFSLQKKGHGFSPKQQACLDRIYRERFP